MMSMSLNEIIKLPKVSIDKKVIYKIRNGDYLIANNRYFEINDLREPKIKQSERFSNPYVLRECKLKEVGTYREKFYYTLTDDSTFKIVLISFGKQQSIYEEVK